MECVKSRLNQTVRDLHKSGYRTFISGMSRGFELNAAHVVVSLSDELPDIELTAVVPFLSHNLLYDRHERTIYDNVLKKVKSKVLLSKGYSPDIHHILAHYLVISASVVVCYDNGQSPETRYAIEQATRLGVSVVNLCQSNVERSRDS